jgi:hypothetical protein
VKFGFLYLVDEWTGCREQFRDVIRTNGDAEHGIIVNYVADTDFKKCPFKLTVKGDQALEIIPNIQLLNEVMRTVSNAL